MIIRNTLKTAKLAPSLFCKASIPRPPFYCITQLKQSQIFRLKPPRRDNNMDSIDAKHQPQISKSIYDEVQDAIALYPFAKMREYSQEQLSNVDQETKNIVLAWQCLEIKDKAELKKAHNLLLPEAYHLSFVQKKGHQNGQTIFSTYFQKHLAGMAEILNSPQSTEIQKICCLNTLLHMRSSSNFKEHLKFMRKETSPSLFLVFWVVIKIKNELPYLNNLKAVEEALLVQMEQCSPVGIRLLYILTTLPYFYRYYSKPMVKGIFLIFRKNLEQMSFRDILICLKRVYQLNSKYSTWLADELMDFVGKVNSSEDPFFVPLALKVLSYCSVLDLPTEHLVYHLFKKLPNFQKALLLAGVSEEQYVFRLFDQTNLNLSNSEVGEKLVHLLGQYIADKIGGFKEKDEVDGNKLQLMFKLLTKLKLLIEKQALKDLSLTVINIMSKHHQNQQIRFLCLDCLLSFPFLFQHHQLSLTQISQIQSNLKQYFNDSCQTLAGSMRPQRNINQIIQLVSKSVSCNIQLSPSPDLCTIAFKQLTHFSMDIHTFQLLIHYLVTSKLKHPQDLLRALTQLEFIMFSFFNKGLTSFKLILHILTLAKTSNYSNSNLFPKICKAIYQINAKHSHFRINNDELLFLQKQLTEKKRGNPHLDQFIEKCLQDEEKYSHHQKEYLQKEKEFYFKEQSKTGKKGKKG